MWFDSHSHLYELDDVDGVVAKARRAGVANIVALGVDPVTSGRAAELAAATEGVWAAAAVHPTSAAGWDDSWCDAISRLLEDPKVVAVGESGIDLYWDTSFVDDQRAAFAAHIELAKRFSKPLVIHTRESFEVALDVLRSEGPPPALVFHCWTGNADDLREALAIGAHVSFAGNVSFKKNDELRAVAALVPEDRLLVETDSPYMTPHPHRGKPNDPSYLPLVGAAVAAARDVSVGEIEALTDRNAKTLFGIAT
ncbi:MAG TPA: TatD family hydrolase [Actinomycetota bacterium]|nr:TatD family hydrolase [Actinomycetota bacterium]